MVNFKITSLISRGVADRGLWIEVKRLWKRQNIVTLKYAVSTVLRAVRIWPILLVSYI